MIRLAAVLTLAGLLLPQAATALTVTDQTGRRVVLPGLPARIVSLVPSVTETVFTIGAQDRLVGVTDFCDYPPAARQKPSIGGMISPSLEGIVTLRPDLVVATPAGNRHETFDQLGRLKIPVYLVNPVSVQDVLDLIGRVGRLTDRAEAADRVAAALRERIQAVSARVAGRPRPRVLYVLWPDPLIVPGRESMLTELIEVAGGVSITANDAEAYPRFSLETAVARAPEVIILADHSTGTSTAGRAAPEKWKRLTSVPAIQAGRLHSADLSILHRYGPRVPEGIETLARFIHPEAFP